MPFRFAVLKTGEAPDHTERTYGGFGPMLHRLLSDSGDVWDTFSVVDADFSADFYSLLDSYDGFIITGSSADAGAEDVPWIARLCDLLRHLHSSRKKLLGICFGHQILARVLGGKIGRAPVGWEIGVKRLRLESEAISELYGLNLPPNLNVIQCHQDQVFNAPPDAVVLACSDKVDIEMFSVGEHVLGIQCHPEFCEDVMRDIIYTRLCGTAISDESAKAAMKSFQMTSPDQEQLQALCKAFLKGTSRTTSSTVNDHFL